MEKNPLLCATCGSEETYLMRDPHTGRIMLDGCRDCGTIHGPIFTPIEIGELVRNLTMAAGPQKDAVEQAFLTWSQRLSEVQKEGLSALGRLAVLAR